MPRNQSAPSLAEGVQQCLSLLHASRLDVMEALAKNIAATYPSAGCAWQMLGIARLSSGNAAAAVDPLERASKLAAQDASVWDNLGAALNALHEFDRAGTCYERSLQLNPGDARVLSNAAANAGDAGRDADAHAYATRALQLEPTLAHAHLALGNAAARLGRNTDALASIREAVRLAPALVQAHLSLGNVLQLTGDTPSAISATQRALEIAPNFADAHHNLGRYFYDLGRVDLATAHYRAAVRLQPSMLYAWSGWLFCLAHDASIAPANLLAAHREFGEHVERSRRAQWGGWQCSREPDRRLRVGFVSGDLREHAVAHFIEPIWRAIDHRAIEVVAYATTANEDARSARLKQLTDTWHNVATMSDDALAASIREARIDILVDLAGHTGGNRLGVFARKPAPVQVAWIGYPNTTGLTAIDYRLIGRQVAGSQELDAFFTEKLVSLPVGTVFLAPDSMPPVNPLPALARGYLTFGNFNRAIKLTDAVIGLWSKVMLAVPDSRMLIGAISEEPVRARLTERFAQHGIAGARLAFHPRMGMHDYLELHHEIDFILDTFPFTGGTVTNQALWMGVPTLTMTGGTLPHRQGAGIMARAGLAEWIAESEADFVVRAVAISRAPQALAVLRAGLRAELAASEDARTSEAARLVTAALRAMWKRWCTGEAAQAFEVRQ